MILGYIVDFNPFTYNIDKWSLKFLWCEHRKIFKKYLIIFQNYARKGY